MTINEKIQLGINEIKNNSLGNAEQIFTNLQKENPLNSEINHFLGITYQLQNKIDEAVLSYKKTIEIDPKFAEAHKNLGNMFYRLGKINEAELCFTKALEVEPQLEEAKTVLNVILEQKKILSMIKKKEISKKKETLSSNPYIKTRPVESDLIKCLYKMDLIELNKTKDIRYGNGKCSPDLKLFNSNLNVIQKVKKDLTEIMEESVNSKIFIVESFFNILSSNSGTTPHKHIDPFDKSYGIVDQKYSIVYYISTGDQTGTEPGILKLYDPDKELLPSEGLIAIFPADRKHSSIYNGKKDRIMIGVNFYSLS